QLFINFEEPTVETGAQTEETDLGFNPVLLKKVDELELSVRSA
ncbi:MAG TPA: DNA-directed RNA polymerase subunit alpha, partial [Hyphomonas sp.]|nr:DNA-directed RNA polymerase subunit alpha [Hyphomonas sp.]